MYVDYHVKSNDNVIKVKLNNQEYDSPIFITFYKIMLVLNVHKSQFHLMFIIMMLHMRIVLM